MMLFKELPEQTQRDLDLWFSKPTRTENNSRLLANLFLSGLFSVKICSECGNRIQSSRLETKDIFGQAAKPPLCYDCRRYGKAA